MKGEIELITVELGKKIKQLRMKKGLSQEKFALEIGMDRTYFASVEAGKRNISICNIKKIADGLPYRDYMTLGVLVNHLNLENKTDIKTVGDIVPDCWVYVQDRTVKMGRFQIYNNWSPYMVEKPEDTVWIGLEYFCAEGDDFWNMSEEDCVKFATAELVKMGVISEYVVLDSHREKVKKAYPAY